MKAGDLRDRVTLQRLAESPDEFGGAGTNWVTTATVWASVKSVVGRGAGGERVTGEAAEGVSNLIIIIRYRAGITAKQRITFRGRTLEIANVADPDGRRRMLQLLCREVT